jgi:hypothetical protein
MKSHALVLPALLAVAAAGCASAGFEQADTTASRIQDVRLGMDRFRGQADATLEALAALQAEPRTGLKEKYDAYARAVDGLSREESALKSAVETMRVAAQNRLRAWERESAAIANPDIRGRAEERRGSVKDSYQAADSAISDFVVAMGPFAADLRDLRLVLSNDLTPSGLDAVRDTVSRARNAGGRLSGRTRPVGEALDRAVAEFSTGEPAPAPEKADEKPAEAASAEKK